jgi:hypothetical protein
MKATSILQMIFGALDVFAAWSLTTTKAHVITHPSLPGGGIWIDSSPPEAVFEFVLLFLGLAILTCGYFQRRRQMEGAAVQLVNGVIIAIISGFLAIRAVRLGYGEVSAVYYLAYIPLILGLVVFVVGIRQLTHAFDLRK